MRLFLVAKPNDYCAVGRFVRELDQGFELQEVKMVDGKQRCYGTNILLDHAKLSRFLVPVNLKRQFRYQDGKAMAVEARIYNRQRIMIAKPEGYSE